MNSDCPDKQGFLAFATASKRACSVSPAINEGESSKTLINLRMLYDTQDMTEMSQSQMDRTRLDPVQKQIMQ